MILPKVVLKLLLDNEANSTVNLSISLGVRALLIDKDQKPNWNPKTLEDCTPEKIQSYFEPIDPELKLYSKL